MLSFHHILVGVDFGSSSEAALEVAIQLSEQYRSALTLVHTWEFPVYGYGAMEFNPVDVLGPMQQTAGEQLEKLLVEVRKKRPDVKGHLGSGVAWKEILACIENLQPDLVVMGTHGREGLRHLILGSVAEKIVRLSPCAVLTVRGKANADVATGE